METINPADLAAASNIWQDVTVTNDGATILSLLDIEHPAGKILVDLAQQQDKEVRVSTTDAHFKHTLII